jgi:hypothetical protein
MLGGRTVVSTPKAQVLLSAEDPDLHSSQIQQPKGRKVLDGIDSIQTDTHFDF